MPDRETLMTTTAPLEDVFGKDVMAGARKDDTGKVLAGLNYEYFPHALNEVSKVSTFGANKYSRGGFRHVPNKKERYFDGYHRHQLAHQMGEKNDPESGLPHLAHAAWNALALLQFSIEEAAAEETKKEFSVQCAVEEERKAYHDNI